MSSKPLLMRRASLFTLTITLTGLLAVSSNQATAAESIPEPISLYKFDEATGATTIEDSIRGASGLGTIYGAPTFQPGQVGNAMCLNGTNQYAKAPIIVGGLKEFTISAWAKSDVHQTWGTVVKNWGDPDVGNFHLGLDGSSGNWSNYIGRTISSSSQVGVNSPTVAPVNQWQYLVTTVSESAGEIKLYVDGTLVDSDSFTGTIAQFGSWMSFGIKLLNDGIGTSAGWFKGCIDEVAFWDVALTSAQLSAIRNGGGGVFEAIAATQPAAITPPVAAPAPATTTAPTLATTGANVEWLMGTGILIALAGSGFLAFSRRKRIS